MSVRPWRAFSVDIFSHEALRGPDEIVAWLLMIRWARFTDDPENGLKRGQFRITRGELARRLQKLASKDPHRAKEAPRWTRNRASSFVRRMEDSGSLATTPEGEGPRATTLFTVLNYDKYQQKTRNSSEPVAKRPGTSSETLDRNQNGNLEETGNTNETTGKQSGNTSETHRETGSKRQDLRDNPPNPPGEAAGAAEDEKGKSKGKKKTPRPPVKAFGDWPAIAAEQKWTQYPYPEEFDALWTVWRQTAERNPDVHNRAVGRPMMYRLVLQWLHDGLTIDAITEATKEYLRPFARDPDKTHSQMPSTFYSRANPTLLDRCEGLGSAPVGKTGRVTLETFGTLRRAFSFARAAALRLGVERPEFNDSDGWEAFTACDAEIQRVAVQMVGE